MSNRVNRRIVSAAMMVLTAIACAASHASAAVIDISGDINVDAVVGPPTNSGRLAGFTQTFWNSGTTDSDIDLNGFEFSSNSGGGNASAMAGAISGNGTYSFFGGPWWGGLWNAPIFVQGAVGNTYTGATNVYGGLTVMNKASGNALAGTITVGDTVAQINVSGNARLQWNADDQVSDLSDVIVLPKLHNEADPNNATYLILNGFNDTINSLTLYEDAHVRTDDINSVSGSLVVNALSYFDAANNETVYGPGVYTSDTASFIVGGGSITVLGPVVAVPAPAALPAGIAMLAMAAIRRRR